MTYDDFINNFMSVSVCHNINTTFLSAQKKWNEAAFHSEWRLPDRAGGCINNKKTFLNNPQVAARQCFCVLESFYVPISLYDVPAQFYACV